MKKIFIKFSAPATLALAIVLNSCNNAEENKKKEEEQNTQIQTQVDERLNALQDQVNAECTAMVDSIATVRYDEWYAAEGKKKGAAKPKPKPVAKKDEPKEGGLGTGKAGTEKTPAKLGEGKAGTSDTAKLGKGKLGRTPQ